MDWKQRSAAVRAEIARRHQQGARGRVPEALKAEVLECLRARRAQGATAEQVASELGLRHRLLERWAAEARPRDMRPALAGFHAVQVVAEPAKALQRGGLVVHGPGGLRVEGLSLEQVAELLRRVGR